MTITLPLPAKGLSPNARIHHMRKASLTRKARERALWEVKAKIGMGPRPVFTGYSLAFYWPDRRRRDDDNACASCKAYRDGIAQALGVDDSTLRMTGAPAMKAEKENPRLEITLLP